MYRITLTLTDNDGTTENEVESYELCSHDNKKFMEKLYGCCIRAIEFALSLLLT